MTCGRALHLDDKLGEFIDIGGYHPKLKGRQTTIIGVTY